VNPVVIFRGKFKLAAKFQPGTCPNGEIRKMRRNGIYVLPGVVLVAAAVFLTSCEDKKQAGEPIKDDPKPVAAKEENMLEKVAKELAKLSPIVDPADAAARDKAAEALKLAPVLSGVMGPVFTWGQHKGGGYAADAHIVTELDSMVWRGLYLSLYMFSGEHAVLERDGLTVLRMKGEFRSKLDAGQYPYPFWHKPAKWTDYQRAVYVDLVFDKGRLTMGYRSFDKKDIAEVKREFDGKWEWIDKDGHAMPKVALYNYLLSPKNPHAEKLEQAFRAFATEARSHSCMDCHSPDNKKNMSKLSILNYPSQALNSRHYLVSLIEKGEMPPKTKVTPAGIPNPVEKKKFLDLAREFAETADKALEFEAVQAKTK
jgi:hypothetical protein